MPINAEWHRAHQMPKNPTLDQRIEWHIAHTEACACRKPSPKLQQQIEEYRGRRTS